MAGSKGARTLALATVAPNRLMPRAAAPALVFRSFIMEDFSFGTSFSFTQLDEARKRCDGHGPGGPRDSSFPPAVSPLSGGLGSESGAGGAGAEESVAGS